MVASKPAALSRALAPRSLLLAPPQPHAALCACPLCRDPSCFDPHLTRVCPSGAPSHACPGQLQHLRLSLEPSPLCVQSHDLAEQLKEPGQSRQRSQVLEPDFSLQVTAQAQLPHFYPQVALQALCPCFSLLAAQSCDLSDQQEPDFSRQEPSQRGCWQGGSQRKAPGQSQQPHRSDEPHFCQKVAAQVQCPGPCFSRLDVQSGDLCDRQEEPDFSRQPNQEGFPRDD